MYVGTVATGDEPFPPDVVHGPPHETGGLRLSQGDRLRVTQMTLEDLAVNHGILRGFANSLTTSG